MENSEGLGGGGVIAYFKIGKSFLCHIFIKGEGLGNSVSLGGILTSSIVGQSSTFLVLFSSFFFRFFTCPFWNISMDDAV